MGKLGVTIKEHRRNRYTVCRGEKMWSINGDVNKARAFALYLVREWADYIQNTGDGSVVVTKLPNGIFEARRDWDDVTYQADTLNMVMKTAWEWYDSDKASIELW